MSYPRRTTKTPSFSLFAPLLLLSSAMLPGCGDSRPARSGPSIQKRIDEAMNITSPDARAKQLVRIAYAANQEGSYSGARMALTNAVQAARIEPDPALRASAYNAIVFAYAKLEMVSDAERTLIQARNSAAEIADPLAKIGAYCSLAIANGAYLNRPEIATEHVQVAVATLEEVSDPFARCDAMQRVAYTFERLGLEGFQERWRLATESVAGLTDPRQRADATANAGEYRHRLSDPEQGDVLFQEARQLADALEPPFARGYALVHLAGKQIEAKQVAAARQSLGAASEAARAVSDPGLRRSLEDDIRRTMGN